MIKIGLSFDKNRYFYFTLYTFTQDMRDKLLRACLEFEAIILPEVGRITYLGTPQTEESIYNKLRERAYKAIIIPSEYPSLEYTYRYSGDLDPYIQEQIEKHPQLIGHSTDPQRFSDQDLMEKKASFGRAGYTLQFMLDTSLSDAERYPLKTSDIIVLPDNPTHAPISISWSSSPEYQIKDLPCVGFTGDRWYRPLFIADQWISYEGSVMAIDPSGRGGDRLGYAVVKQLHGYLFVTSAGSLPGGYEDNNLITLSRIARDHKVNYCIVESNFGDGMFTRILTPIMARYHPCTIEEIRNSIQKEKRVIDTLEPVLNRHRLVIYNSVIKQDIKLLEENPNHSLFYQLTRITRERGALKHDDAIDALSMAVGYWVNSMARDEVKAVEDYTEALREKELQKFMDNVIFREYRPKKNKWM